MLCWFACQCAVRHIRTPPAPSGCLQQGDMRHLGRGASPRRPLSRVSPGAKRSRRRRAQCGVQIRRAVLVGAPLRGDRSRGKSAAWSRQDLITTVAGVYDILFGMRRCRINLPDQCYHLISRVAHRALEGGKLRIERVAPL